ncbi:MAG: hypothetical protein ACRCT8_03010 [Lacipirellulaceae bacterium]
MGETALERLCASPKRWLIVTGVTLLLALASVLPQVDVLIAARSERSDLEGQIERASRTADLLPKYELRVVERTEALELLRRQEVDETRVDDLRTWMVAAVRQAGCQVRRLDLGASTRRDWAAKDDPLQEAKRQLAPHERTPFQLETRPVTVSVTGGSEEVRSLLKAIDADPRAKHTQQLELKPTAGAGSELQLDVTLWYFALVKATPAAA